MKTKKEFGKCCLESSRVESETIIPLSIKAAEIYAFCEVFLADVTKFGKKENQNKRKKNKKKQNFDIKAFSFHSKPFKRIKRQQ